ncbi:MAG: glycosyltransferase family 2 protein [Patescibacteria group bacterium]
MLSVVIITLNEEKNLVRCLTSVKDLADEIVIVDSGSRDKTLDIAKSFGAKVFVRKFEDYGSQKNFATQKASGDWLLSLDADEEITGKLRDEIREAVKTKEFSAYSIPRKNIILGKFIRFTRWQPQLDRHVWLFKKGSGEWVGGVHEEFVVKGKVGKLKYPKIHHQYETVSEFLDMVNRYSQLDAEKRIKKGTKFSLFKLFFDPTYNFLVRYFYRLGFLDGWRGFVLSFLMAVYHFEVWVKIWEKENA